MSIDRLIVYDKEAQEWRFEDGGTEFERRMGLLHYLNEITSWTAWFYTDPLGLVPANPHYYDEEDGREHRNLQWRECAEALAETQAPFFQCMFIGDVDAAFDWAMNAKFSEVFKLPEYSWGEIEIRLEKWTDGALQAVRGAVQAHIIGQYNVTKSGYGYQVGHTLSGLGMYGRTIYKEKTALMAAYMLNQCVDMDAIANLIGANRMLDFKMPWSVKQELHRRMNLAADARTQNFQGKLKYQL